MNDKVQDSLCSHWTALPKTSGTRLVYIERVQTMYIAMPLDTNFSFSLHVAIS